MTARRIAAVLVLLCGVTLALGFANKDRCTGPFFSESGRSEPDYGQRNFADFCYSDIQFLWQGRDVDKHVFPYVGGGLNERGDPVGGTVEYPVLTGMLIWAGAAFANTDAGFLALSALLLAPFGLLTGWLLGRLAGWRALLWAIGPPLVLYAFHNWDLAAVAASVAAFAVLLLKDDWSLRRRATAAAVLLGLGFALKLYPALFVAPLALYVLTGGRAGKEGDPASPWLDVRGALRVVAVALGTAVAVNLPFALAGFRGWWASFEFQADRKIDVTTNSLWYWAFRPESDPDKAGFQSLVGVLSPVLVLASFALACVLGWRRYRREGEFPFLPVCAAMLCGFLLLHKVHSPQYTLWLLPMFVLVRVRLPWVFAYFAADLALGIGLFRWFGALQTGHGSGIYDGFAAQAVMIGVWGRAALLAGLFFAFLAAEPVRPREPRLPRGRGPVRPAAGGFAAGSARESIP
ncbi:glycosyltransferase family 87 protein [Amycolatopsis anabasis]|uniref:glycosyltransferase family 87 protein n=1 Tax=Amycolatopsis anabasis TaxID=1840409 RepID=UPI001FE25286|nr:glycosyltransferase 87 family protein [Amycolatopsis anabasis]